MKKLTRVLAAAAAVIMAFSLFAGTALASSYSDAVPMDTAGSTVHITSGGDIVSGADVSGSDVSGSDAQSLLAPLGTTFYNFKDFGVKVEVPNYTQVATVESTNAEANDALGISLADLIDSGYIFYSCDETMSDNFFFGSYTVSDYTKMVRDYSRLSDEQKADILEQANVVGASQGFGTINFIAFDTINNKDFVHYSYINTVADQLSGKEVKQYFDIYETISNGVRFTFISRATGISTKEDLDAYANLGRSIKLYNGKLGFAFQGTSAANTALMITTIVLAVLVVLLAFFLIRFSAFQRSAGSSFNIFGFDFPGGADGSYDEDVDELEDFDYDEDEE